MRLGAAVLFMTLFGFSLICRAEDAGGEWAENDASRMLLRAEAFENAVANNLASAEYILKEIMRLHPGSPESAAAEAKLAWVRDMNRLASTAPGGKGDSRPAIDPNWAPGRDVPDAEQVAALALADKAMRENTYESLHGAAYACQAYLIRHPDADGAWKVRRRFDEVDSMLRKMTGQPAKKALARKELARKFRMGESMGGLIDMATSVKGDAAPLNPGTAPATGAGAYSLDEPTYELLVIPGQ